MRDDPGLSFEDFKKSSYLPSLDGLRAIAVVLVYIVHFSGTQGTFLTGWLGVQVFFVLSGFLITTLLLRENDANGKIDLRAFYMRRAFRIVPVYWLVLAFTVWQTYHQGGEGWDQLKHSLPYYLTFLNEQNPHAPLGITWTLGIEWKFYLVWPLLAFIVARTNAVRTIVAIVVCAVLIKFWNTGWLNPYHYLTMMMGSMLAMLMNSRRGFKLVAPLTRPPVALLVFIAFAVWQTQVVHVWHHLDDAKLADLYGFSVVFLIPSILGPGLPRRLLTSKPFVFVGKRSYALYLTQFIATQAVTGFAPWHGQDFWFVGMSLIAGLFITDVLLRYVEKPCIAYGHQLIERWNNGRAHLGSTISPS